MNMIQTTAGLNPTSLAIRRARTWRSLFVGGAIIAAHAAIAVLMMRMPAPVRAGDPVLPMIAEIIELQPASFLSLNSELAPAEPNVVLKMPDSSEKLESTELSRLPPMIDPELRVDVAAYSARALLPSGSVAAVILLLEIGPDGSVMSAQVVRSNAGEIANEAAIDYAKATRWKPGTVDGVPMAMQASLTVILGEQV